MMRPVMWEFLAKYGLAGLSGAVLALCFPTWSLYPLAWVALVPLLYRSLSLTPRHVALQFFIAGVAFHLILLQWLLANINWAGGWAVWGYIILSCFLSVYWAGIGFIWTWMRSHAPKVGGPWSLALLWGGMEWLQSWIFTGFGWGSLGYSQGKDIYVLQWAAIGGGITISVLIVLCNGFLAYALKPGSRTTLFFVGALIVVLGSHGAGMLLLRQADYGDEPFRAGVLQSDFPLEMKWDREYTLDMVQNAAAKSRKLVENAPVDLFVWPEALIMTTITTPAIAKEVTTLSRDTQTPLFTGAVRYDQETGESRNSSHLIESDGKIVGHYDKVHLAPFGEYVPLSDYLPFIKQVVPAIGAVGMGDTQEIFETGGRRFGPLICFEVLFPDMSEFFRERGTDFLIVITNLAWFGASNAIPQELEIARMRAVETRLPLVHAANTGISGVFDPWGRFELADWFMAPNGEFYQPSRALHPFQTIMQRTIESLPVAKPAPRPLGAAPYWLPRTYFAIALGLIIASWVVSRRAMSTQTSQPKPQ